MNEYYVYCIKEEVAEGYFYKYDLLYRFLKSFQENNERIDLSRQFNYITIEYPFNLLTYILPNLKKVPSIQMIKKDKQIDLYTKSGNISVFLHKNYLKVHCSTLQEAETILFPALKLFYPYLFIMGTNVDEYGWISPHVLHNSYFLEKQTLYS